MARPDSRAATALAFAETGGPPLLAIEGLRVAYGAVAAIRGVNLSVRAGEVVALLGANGAGKSSMLRSISGIVRPRARCIRLDATVISRLPPARIVRLGIGHCPEGRRIFGSLTVAENLRLGAAARDDRAADLPYGDQRRLELVRALATAPRLLMLDEPAAGMNAAETKGLMKLIDDIRHRYRPAVVVVEHDMDLIMNLCDRIQVLAHGEVIFEGSPAEVQANPRVREVYLGQA